MANEYIICSLFFFFNRGESQFQKKWTFILYAAVFGKVII